MTGLVFYTNPMSRGQIARWALHEVGAEYEEHLVAFGPTMKAPDFLAINPMGKVPAIVHDGRAVTEAAAICLYLAEAFPAASLAPASLAEKADCYRWMFFAAGPLESAVVNRSLGWHVGDDPRLQGRVGYGSYERTCSALSGWFEKHDYVCGERFTIADVYVGSQVDWGLQFQTVPTTASLEAYAARLRSREAYRAAKAIDAAHIARQQEKS